MRTVHVITGLPVGGAQIMLYSLLKEMSQHSHTNEVVCLAHHDIMSDKIRSLGINVHSLGMHSGRLNLFRVFKLVKWLRLQKPDIVQTWMYHADLLGAVAAKIAGNIPVVWGIHHSDLLRGEAKKTTVFIAKLCAALSSWLPKRIICCSEASKRFHTRMKYNRTKMIVIPNGFDLDTFKPNPIARPMLLNELVIPASAVIIGVIGRFHPMKDHRNFIKAAGRLVHNNQENHFLFCGAGLTWQNESLVKWIHEAGIASRSHLLGLRENIQSLLPALDIVVSCSSGEAFPIVIGEAMSCGVPCVVTDVGDSALIVGNTGQVVPPKNPEALANAIEDLIELGREKRRELGLKARQRIYQNFSLARILAKYSKVYKAVINN